MRDQKVNTSDVFAQEFFLFAYSHMMRSKQEIIESSEGNTFIKLHDHNTHIRHILGFFRGESGSVVGWNERMATSVKSIASGADGTIGQYLDLDFVLTELYGLYQKQRK